MTDNGSPADANAASASAEQFPIKLRVHALARTLGLTSRQVLAHLAELGAEVRSAQSSVDRELAHAVADRVRQHVEVDASSLAAVDGDASVAGPAAVADVAGSAQTEPTKASQVLSAPTVPDVPSPSDGQPESADQQAPGQAEPEAPAAPDSEAVSGSEAVSDSQVASDTQDGPDSREGSDSPAEPDGPAEITGTEQRDEPTLFSAAASRYDKPIPGEIAAAPAGPLFLQPQTPEPVPKKTRTSESTVVSTNESVAPTQLSSGRGDGPTDEGRIDDGRSDEDATDDDTSDDGAANDGGTDDGGSGRNRRRRRGRRGRGRGRGEQSGDDDESTASPSDSGEGDQDNNDSDSFADEGDASSAQPSEESGTRKKSGKPSGKKGKKSKGKTPADDDADLAADASQAADAADPADESEDADADAGDADGDNGGDGSTRRRRRRRRRKGGADSDESASPDDPPNTVVHEREPRSKRAARDEVQGITGSTRLEAKRQRRRDGRDAGRRRPPILTESEFLARREAVDRVMVVRERSANSRISVVGGGAGSHDHVTPVEDYTQVAVLEDGVLVEHFVTTATSSSMVGNIYLGRVQNVLPGMEAAFVDIGRGRNGVLYAGEVNWDAAGLDGGSRKIEQALKPGDNVLVQVSKDPVGHKGARLTTQISLAGRYLVYVPGGSSTGISRKLPDVERKRLKQILSKLVPSDAGVIIRTASEGVSAEELGADIARLEAQWKSIEESIGEVKKNSGSQKNSGSSGPKALYEEPDLLVRVVRDLFNEDFKKLVVEGDNAWNLVDGYVRSVAPDLLERVEKFEKPHADAPDSFVVHRVDEQLAKALDRKVWLPSGGTLIIEHTEAMTVVDVNTGKFTGSGGNLEETVTRNNLEAAEEIVRQMRLRDIGGMIIVDFIDMVLESNRDLVLRRLTEALARDRTRHQVSEVTSLGLVQMTRKRLGTGLLEAFSTTCTTCGGRGIIVHANPVEVKTDDGGHTESAGSKRSRRSKRKSEALADNKPAHKPAEHPMFRAMAAHSHDEDGDAVLAESDIDAGPADPDGTLGVETDVAPESDAVTTSDSTPEPGADPKLDGTATIVATPKSETTPEPEAAPTAEAAPQDESGPRAEAVDTAPKRRRRVVRRAASPTAAPEPVIMTAHQGTGQDGVRDIPAPLTTYGPSSAPTTDAVVAVHRRPRRRSAGRPAGPPPAEQ